MYILAVDDEKYMLDSLEGELKKVFPEEEIYKENNSVNAYYWVQELAEKGETLGYAFLDIEMPQINGIELAIHIKKLFPAVRLIFCTAYKDYAMDAFSMYAKGYLLKPVRSKDIIRVLDEMVTDWRSEYEGTGVKACAQTFGYFELFVDGKPVVFEREKAKEALAYIIDRQGASVTNKQLSAILWEDRPYDSKQRNITTTIISSLKKTLRDYGIEDLLVKSWGHVAVDINKLKCDAYDFEKGDPVAINAYHGEYMSNYSWAEMTAGTYDSVKYGL